MGTERTKKECSDTLQTLRGDGVAADFPEDHDFAFVTEFFFASWYRLWAWDMSGELAFGKGFQMMGNGGDKTGCIDMIDAGTQFGGVVTFHPFPVHVDVG